LLPELGPKDAHHQRVAPPSRLPEADGERADVVGGFADIGLYPVGGFGLKGL
jgi:hypothetical protein